MVLLMMRIEIWIRILRMHWNPAPKNFSLGSHELHLWKLRLPLADSVENFLNILLNSKEKARAERFYFPRDRRRFSQFRGFLRFLMGQYLQEPPERISLETNPNGKPFLSPQKGIPKIFFNLAHSEDLALFAFTTVGDLGVDVEKLKDPYDGEKLAERYFSPQESGYLSSIPQNERAMAFFRLWTLKEAYLKAMGLGFSGGLDTFSVQITTGTGTAMLQGRHPNDRRDQWVLKYFAVGERFVGALVAPGGIQEILSFDGNQIEVLVKKM
jgi:4'-phosphopantetheinyl transferase